MTIEYEDMVRSINNAYWQALMDNDAKAREVARQTAELYGFARDAGDNIVNEFSLAPLQEWLGHRSGGTAAYEQDPMVDELSRQQIAQEALALRSAA